MQWTSQNEKSLNQVCCAEVHEKTQEESMGFKVGLQSQELVQATQGTFMVPGVEVGAGGWGRETRSFQMTQGPKRRKMRPEMCLWI